MHNKIIKLQQNQLYEKQQQEFDKKQQEFDKKQQEFDKHKQFQQYQSFLEIEDENYKKDNSLSEENKHNSMTNDDSYSPSHYRSNRDDLYSSLNSSYIVDDHDDKPSWLGC